MVTIRIAGEEDRRQWDSYIQAHQDSSVYHLWAWKRTVEATYGHKTHYLLAENSDGICGVFPLIRICFPLFINSIFALPFCDVGNCLADSVQIQENLLTKGVAFASKQKCTKIQLRGPLLEVARSYELIVEKTGKVQMSLSLPKSSDVLLKGFKSKLRSQIRKAEKNSVQFEWAAIEGVESFYDVYSTNMRDLGSPPHSQKWFRNIMQYYGEKSKIGLTRYKGKIIGAGLILSTDNQTSIPWASTLREYNYLSPNMLLYWNLLKFSADNDITSFDFGRSTKGEGTYRFKKQWGAVARELVWYSHLFGGECRYKEKKCYRSKVVSMWSKLPLSVSNVAGSYLRRYISL